MTLLDVVICSLALWRVASLFSREAGPLDVFYHIREGVGIHHDDNGNILEIEDKWLPRLMSCVWCLSMFLALFYAPLVCLWHTIVVWISLPFAMSAIAIGMEELIHGKS